MAVALLGVVPALAQQAAKPAAGGGRPTMARDTSLAGIDTTGGKVEYWREVFHYTGGARDPFQTLMTSSDVRPMLSDLRLVSVIYDPYYGRSVAVVREEPGNKIHRLRRGDTIGRLRVLQIRQYEVVFQIEEFGFERQEVLSLQRQVEANP
ncbi:MAG: hypothetical protein B7Z72_08660 [Gemmatimonadetes bacterium 21-71-4]|nr:MAG: hypothetical protein B7Z72_08660 [Gemmatimonadetes bacterium 21-71-4]